MTTTTHYDYKQLVRAELADMSAFLHTLSPDEWEHPTLCEGWKVRHVVGHFVAGYSVSLPKTLWILATDYKFSFPRAVHEFSIRTGEENSPETLLAEFDRWTTEPKHRGIATVGPMKEHYLDHMIHQWDISIPLGKTRQISEDRKLAALAALVTISGMTGITPVKKFGIGRRLVATDVNWQFGEGEEVRGSTMDLVLGLTGRRIALERLEGPGAEGLRQDLQAKWDKPLPTPKPIRKKETANV